MLSRDSKQKLLTEVAKACDFCLKPYRYSVIENLANEKIKGTEDSIDLTLTGECRSCDGHRLSDKDLEIEIYRSGLDISITLAWLSFPNKPILWYGKHSVWMDSTNGLRVNNPVDAYELEALARRLRSSLSVDE